MTSPKYWIPIIVPLLTGLIVWAFNTNAEFARREIRLQNMEQRNDRLTETVVRIEKKIDDLKDLIIQRGR